MTPALKASNNRIDAAAAKLRAEWAKDGYGIVFNPIRPDHFGFGKIAGEPTLADLVARKKWSR